LGELDTGVLQAEALDPWTETNGDHGAVDGDGLGLVRTLLLVINLDRIAVVAYCGGGVAWKELDTPLLVGLGHDLGYFCVLVRKNAVHEFDEGHVHAVVTENV